MNWGRWIWLCLLVLNGSEVNSQTPRADSILERVRSSKDPLNQLAALLHWAEDCQSINRDTLDVWMPKLYSLAAEQGDMRSKSLATIAFAHWYLRWGWADSAMFYLKPELDRYRPDDSKNRDLWYRAKRLQVMCFFGKSRYAEALENLFTTVSVAERYGDSLWLALACNSIGSVKMAMGKTDEALPWIRRALLISQGKPSLATAAVPSQINMGLMHQALGQLDSANLYLDRALPTAQQIQDLNLFASALRVKSRLLMQEGRLEAAEATLKNMMAIRAQMSGQLILVEDNIMLANFYEQTGQWQKAIDVCRQNLVRGSLQGNPNTPSITVNNDPKNRYSYLEVLARCLKKAGRTDEYLLTVEELLAAKDSLYAANSAEAIARYETAYQVKEKEAVIASQKLELWKRNLTLTISGLMVVLAVVLAVWAFWRHRLRQQQALAAESERQQREAAAAIGKAEEQERQRIAADLHDNLGAHAAAIASNMGMIPLGLDDQMAGQALQEVRSNASLMVRQLNDTIWALKKESLPLTAIADRIKGFIAQIQASHQEVLIEVMEQLPTDPVLPAVQAYHLYRVMQEAVTNALKHGKASRVWISFSHANGQWMVEVVDNGAGIGDWVNAKGEGSGLMNMRQRCGACGWSISWIPNGGGGTVVRVMPTPN